MRAKKTRFFGVRSLVVFSSLFVLGGLMCLEASAQRGGGNRLSPEKAQAAWSAQSGGIAHEAGLSSSNAEKLASAYAASRESQGTAIQELFSSGQRGPGMFQEMQGINEKERKALAEALGEFLSDSEAGKVMVPLGTFSRDWDRLMSALLDLEVEDDASEKVYPMISAYVVKSDEARAEAMASMDFQSMRETSRVLREELDGQVSGVLSEEQMTAWKSATARPQFGGRGGRPSPPGGGRGRPGGQN